MNCEEARPLLEEYFDGELAAGAAARVAAHLAACAPCAALHAALACEQQFYLGAEPEAADAAQLWAGVSARLAADGRGGRVARLWRGVHARTAFAAFGAPRFSPALTAAAVLAAVALTAGVMKYLDAPRQTHTEPPAVARQGAAPDSRRDPSGDASASAGTATAQSDDVARAGDDDERGSDDERGGGDGAGRAPAERTEGGASRKTEVAAAVARGRVAATPLAEGGARARVRYEDLRRGDTPDELVRDAERKYVAAIALLARDVRRRRTALDAAESARFERTLAAVDRAIAETRRAARSRPADPVAAQYMLAAYSKKVDLLREMASH